VVRGLNSGRVWHGWPLLTGSAFILAASGSGVLVAQSANGDATKPVTDRRPTMSMVLERTIFQVDILTLEIWFPPDVERRLAAATSGRALSPSLADSLATLALEVTDVVARLHFKRGVSFTQFVDAIRDNARRARDAGIIPAATYDDISLDLPVWYAFLRDRKVHEGDEMVYRIRGDTLRTVYQDDRGVTLLDQVDVGAERRLAVMGGYFAPRSDFRKRLLESLFDE